MEEASKEKVAAYWAHQEEDFSRGRYWTEIPEVKQRINRFVTGDPDLDIFAYVIRKYFQEKGNRIRFCMNLGCGSGVLERGLSQYFEPDTFLAFDISPELIGKAIQQRGRLTYIDYRVADLNQLVLPEAEADLVIAHQSIHHVENLEELFFQVRKSLKPDGIFLVDEYIGPARFQWTDRQLQCINAVLDLLPDTLAASQGSKRPPVRRPTPQEVIRVDPSEAIRSDEIVPLLQQHFRVQEFRPYGGTLLHMLFYQIAANFKTPRGREFLPLVFAIEDLLLPELGHDFAAMVCCRY